MYSIEQVEAFFQLNKFEKREIPTQAQIKEYENLYNEFQKSGSSDLEKWYNSRGVDDLSSLKELGFTYVDWFGINLDGYIYVGPQVKKGCPLIVYEEGSGMKVWQYGLGYLLNSGSTGFEDCIIYCHKRKSSIEANDVTKVVKLLKQKFKGIYGKVYGIGFSNGAQSIVNAEETTNLFDGLIVAGGTPTVNYMKKSNKPRTVVLVNSAGRIRNFDSVGRKLPADNVEAYLIAGQHTALDDVLSNKEFIRAFLNGEKFSTETKPYIYTGLYKMDKKWLKKATRNLSKCKYK